MKNITDFNNKENEQSVLEVLMISALDMFISISIGKFIAIFGLFIEVTSAMSNSNQNEVYKIKHISKKGDEKLMCCKNKREGYVISNNKHIKEEKICTKRIHSKKF